MNKKSGFWRRLVNQLWFVPAACVLGAILLAQLMVGLDRMIPPDSDSVWVDWVYAVGIDGSRSMLSAIGGSMLGVAATAFSITISVVATASSTYGPRLVRNFMADRINQVVLGVLVSTFIYTLLVLRTIRSASDDLASPFVPHIAVNFAVLLAIADVALLVYFIHHIADSVQVNTLAHGVRRRFLTVIERWYPEETPEEMTRTLSDRPGGELIRAEKTGYIVDMDFEKIRSCAEEKDLRVTMIPGVGDHILPGEPLFRVWPESLADDVEKTLRGSVALGDSRSALQDIRFAEQQVVELAVRALSTGTNDPYTAINAVQEVAPGIVTAVSRPVPGDTVVVDGVPRFSYRTIGPAEIVDMPFDQIRPHISGQVEVAEALIDLAARIEAATIHSSIEDLARQHVNLVVEQFRRDDPVDRDLKRVEDYAAKRLTFTSEG